MSPRRVTLLSDFGTADGYAAAMAGVIAAAAPDALTEHVSHDVPPGDLLTAAIALSRYALLYPAGTVHLVVVDPGVGTHRRPIAATIHDRHFVAPDNGVLSLVLRHADGAAVVHIEHHRPGQEPAPTFHGRDIFAPAAGRLARGEPLESLGAILDDPVLLDVPMASREEAAVRGEVLHVDRFGNLITNIPAEWLWNPLGPGAGARDAGGAGASVEMAAARVIVGDVDVGGVRRTYGDVASGELVALIGSLELLEVSVRDGSAAERLGLGRGVPLEVWLA